MSQLKSRNSLDHVTSIRKYVEAIFTAKDLHVLVVEGVAGWGKTTAVEEALAQAGIESLHLGSYSTPLNFYNFLAENPSSVVIADDCAGLLGDAGAMAILKAATWPSRGGQRFVHWGSTSKKAVVPKFEFTGKLIIVCNSFPKTADGDAIRSRGFSKSIDINVKEAADLLRSAANDAKYFEDGERAKMAAEFLIAHLSEESLPQISFRTLIKGYRLAESHPEDWRELFGGILPEAKSEPRELVLELAKQGLKVKDQLKIFEQRTGFSERSFYLYRKDAKISRG